MTDTTAGTTGIVGYTALVTGGGSGIGLGAATRLVRDGAHVTICGRTEEKLAAATAGLRAEAEAVGAAWRPGGHGDVPGRRRHGGGPGRRCGGGGAGPGATWTSCSPTPADRSTWARSRRPTLDAVRSTVDLNLIGTFLCLKHGAPLMAAGVGTGVDGGDAAGGSFIGMSSGAGHFPHRYLWAYGASKAGIDMLCRYAAEELGSTGLRVNTVQPGIIDDELMAFITAGGPLLDDYLAAMPVSRVGTVEDVAAAVRYLAGPESAWVTGVSLPVDGGHHLRHGANYGLLFGE